MQIHSFASEYELARRLAVEAGQLIMRHREAGMASATASSATREARQSIVDGVGGVYPSDATLTAETADCPARFQKDRVWMIDPLVAEQTATDITISIALAVCATPVIGVVYNPSRDVLFGAAWGAGAWVEQTETTRPLRATPPLDQNLRFIVPSARGAMLTAILNELGAHQVLESGSINMPCALIAEGVADVFIHPSPSLPDWQCCAPDLILREAGGSVTDCYGEPLTYNRKISATKHGFVGCAPGLIDVVLASVTSRFASMHPSRSPSAIEGVPIHLVDDHLAEDCSSEYRPTIDRA